MKFAFFACFLVGSHIAMAQRNSYPPYAFGVGLSFGMVSYSSYLENDPTVGIQVDFQRNFNDWFSLRTGLEYVYMFKGQPASINDNQYLEVQPNSLALHIEPLFYYRKSPIQFYGGMELALGTIWQLYTSTYHYPSNPIPVYNYSSETFMTWAYSPTVGFSYSLGKRNRPFGEIEGSIKYQVINPIRDDFGDGLNISSSYRQPQFYIKYRFNLSK